VCFNQKYESKCLEWTCYVLEFVGLEQLYGSFTVFKFLVGSNYHSLPQIFTWSDVLQLLLAGALDYNQNHFGLYKLILNSW